MKMPQLHSFKGVWEEIGDVVNATVAEVLTSKTVPCLVYANVRDDTEVVAFNYANKYYHGVAVLTITGEEVDKTYAIVHSPEAVGDMKRHFMKIVPGAGLGYELDKLFYNKSKVDYFYDGKPEDILEELVKAGFRLEKGEK